MLTLQKLFQGEGSGFFPGSQPAPVAVLVAGFMGNFDLAGSRIEGGKPFRPIVGPFAAIVDLVE